MKGNKLSIHCTSCVFNVNDNCLRYEDTQIPCRFQEVIEYEIAMEKYKQLHKECEKRRSNNNAQSS